MIQQDTFLCSLKKLLGTASWSEGTSTLLAVKLRSCWYHRLSAEQYNVFPTVAIIRFVPGSPLFLRGEPGYIATFHSRLKKHEFDIPVCPTCSDNRRVCRGSEVFSQVLITLHVYNAFVCLWGRKLLLC